MYFKNNLVLSVLDTSLALFFLYPPMVLYWRGAWDLWGVYINPAEYPSPRWGIIAISSLAFLGYFIGPKIQQMLETKTKVRIFLTTRVFLVIYGTLFMGFWRGVWETLDAYIPRGVKYSMLNAACAYIPLVLFRCSRGCIIPPMLVSLDTVPDVLTPNTRLKTKPYTDNYLVDCFFSHFVVNTLVIASWRGLWNILYAIIYPDNEYYADHFCLVLGYIFCVVFYLADKGLALLSCRCARMGFWYKVVYEDVCVLVTFCGHCILWRGAWNCTVRYVFSDPLKGGWFCFITGTAGLILVHNMSYAGAMGCAIDGESGDQDVFFQSKYLRHFYASNEGENNNKPAKSSATSRIGQTGVESNSNADTKQEDQGPIFVVDC